jgi:hypothetical protein
MQARADSGVGKREAMQVSSILAFRASPLSRTGTIESVKAMNAIYRKYFFGELKVFDP